MASERAAAGVTPDDLVKMAVTAAAEWLCNTDDDGDLLSHTELAVAIIEAIMDIDAIPARDAIVGQMEMILALRKLNQREEI